MGRDGVDFGVIGCKPLCTGWVFFTIERKENEASLESLVAAILLYSHSVPFFYLHLFSIVYFLFPLPFFPGNSLEMKVTLAWRMEKLSCLGVFPNPPELRLKS